MGYTSRPAVGDSGIGAPGGPSLADRGIGGTGGTAIVGAVTGFGSILVNGFEIDSTRVSSIQVDGVPASAASLQVGQVAQVVVRLDPNGLVAGTVTVEHEVVGPV